MTGGWFAGAHSGVLGKPVKSRGENIAAVRFINLLARFTGEARWRKAAARRYRAALAYPGLHKRAEWRGPAAGKLPNHGVEYPDLGEAAASACFNRVCSLPVFDAKGLVAAVDRLYR